MPENKKEEKKTIVVAQLPQVNTRQVADEAGKEYDCLTIEEALTEIVEAIREIRSKL